MLDRAPAASKIVNSCQSMHRQPKHRPSLLRYLLSASGSSGPSDPSDRSCPSPEDSSLGKGPSTCHRDLARFEPERPPLAMPIIGLNEPPWLEFHGSAECIADRQSEQTSAKPIFRIHKSITSLRVCFEYALNCVITSLRKCIAVEKFRPSR